MDKQSLEVVLRAKESQPPPGRVDFLNARLILRGDKGEIDVGRVVGQERVSIGKDGDPPAMDRVLAWKITSVALSQAGKVETTINCEAFTLELVPE